MYEKRQSACNQKKDDKLRIKQHLIHRCNHSISLPEGLLKRFEHIPI